MAPHKPTTTPPKRRLIPLLFSLLLRCIKWALFLRLFRLVARSSLYVIIAAQSLLLDDNDNASAKARNRGSYRDYRRDKGSSVNESAPRERQCGTCGLPKRPGRNGDGRHNLNKKEPYVDVDALRARNNGEKEVIILDDMPVMVEIPRRQQRRPKQSMIPRIRSALPATPDRGKGNGEVIRLLSNSVKQGSSGKTGQGQRTTAGLGDSGRQDPNSLTGDADGDATVSRVRPRRVSQPLLTPAVARGGSEDGLTTPRKKEPTTTPSSARSASFSVLRAASERISEILQENRRRLDAGEDPNSARREARRRRAEELEGVRKGWVELLV